NLAIGSLPRLSGRLGVVDRRREADAADAAARRLQVRCHSPDQPVEELSGGNQQKVLIGRWLLREPEVILFDEPTRGIDVGAKFAIYHLIDELARGGKAILVASSELEELMLLCDRIAVMSAGRLVETVARGEWSAAALTAAAFRGLGGRTD